METTKTTLADVKPARKQRPSMERAIYRPPPARTVLKEPVEQNVNPGRI